MENFATCFHSDSALHTSELYEFGTEISDLTAVFQELSFDLDGMVREMFEKNNRDIDTIQQEFIRNGIDSSVTESLTTKRFPPPGFGLPKWPLRDSKCDNKLADLSPENQTEDKAEKTSSRSVSQSGRRKRCKENEDYCVFCYNNHEEQETYLGHSCRDEDGFVVCPKLRKYVCPYCQATGSNAHTKKYCPQKPIITPDDLQHMILPLDGAASSKRSWASRGKKSLRF